MERVIFDTNGYRNLVSGKNFEDIDKVINKLRKKEKKRGIEPLLSPIVAKELLAHVANKKDPSFKKCLNAIKAMYLHGGDNKQYKMIASPELLISKSYFNKTIPSKIATNEAIGQMLFHLAKNPSKSTFTKLQRNLNLNHDHVMSTENEFAKAMRQFVLSVDPAAKGWRIYENDEKSRKKVLDQIRSENTSIEIAFGYIFLVHALLVVSGELEPLSMNELFDRAKELPNSFPEPIALYKLVMESLVNSQFNLFENSRSNFVWDIHLMFNVGDHSISNSKLYFVTDDKAMIRTAVGKNAKYSILTLSEYLEYLN